MPTDPASRAAARRKADLLMASALVREQAGLALDDIDLRTRAWEDRARRLRDRVAAGVGAAGQALASGQPVWARPLAAAGAAAWLVARLRSRPRPGHSEAARHARATEPRAGSIWAMGSLLLVNLPRLVRLGRRAGLAWKLARLWQGQGRPGRGRARDSAKGRQARS